jgi:transposase
LPLIRTFSHTREVSTETGEAQTHGLSNALVEAKNTQLRLLTRIAHGFRNAGALIALGMLKLSGLCPPLPGR